MRGPLRLLLVLTAGLALLTWATWGLVSRTTRSWFERDVSMRADLAISGARQALLARWPEPGGEGLRQILSEITRDERIMAAAACGADLTLLAHTPDYPVRFSCSDLASHLRPAEGSAEWRPYRAVEELPGGEVHVSALPMGELTGPLGFVVLVHDMSFIGRREAMAQQFLLVAFLALTAAGFVLTLVVARLSWRGFRDELRRLLQGGSEKPEFRPLLRDVRELVERIAAEKDIEGGGVWTAQRLKQTLERHLQGERVVIVANREPYIHEKTEDGIRVLHPASGLVTALEPVMRACSGVWVAHGSGSGDRLTADRQGRILVPPGEESYTLRRVWLSREEERGYYYGFSNEGLWPLCHIADARPTFRREDWALYRTVNERFAEAVVEEAAHDPVILVQDYHFALLPRILRRRLPEATIITFWHIPWPNSERFGICPWREELLDGLLGSNILGFHTQFHCNNFFEAADRFLESRIDREHNAVVRGRRSTFVRPYPISIEWPSRWADGRPASECRQSVFSELGLPGNALLGVGVDRLDYTKGIEERLLAVERLLEKRPDLVGRFTFVQLGAPSRTEIDRYRALNETVEAVAARINERFGRGSYRPVVFLRAHHEPPVLFRYYRAADLCYVSSLHDGMNLVAKEFVSAREDELGVLVLSQFTGASRELTEALIVNPYDLDQAAAALAAALEMPEEEQRDRMRSMRRFVAEFNVYRWAGRMLVDTARLRRQDRLVGRLAERLLEPEPTAR
jgi:trehalose 6-phosphate synthase